MNGFHLLYLFSIIVIGLLFGSIGYQYNLVVGVLAGAVGMIIAYSMLIVFAHLGERMQLVLCDRCNSLVYEYDSDSGQLHITCACGSRWHVEKGHLYDDTAGKSRLIAKRTWYGGWIFQ